MAKKSKNRSTAAETITLKQPDPVSPVVEEKFKAMLKIMSWIVGLSFITIIILPNFEFAYLDLLVKIIFFLGVLNLLLFAIIEMFGTAIKKIITKLLQ
jgi:hypothetical protein